MAYGHPAVRRRHCGRGFRGNRCGDPTQPVGLRQHRDRRTRERPGRNLARQPLSGPDRRRPSTTYSYWFEPNPYWSRLFAPGAELKRYAEHVADKYNVRRYMRFNTTVEGAR